jgi:pantoate--beta-alanine ligase
LNLGVNIVVVPTVREPDGLALSSRNVYLTREQRRAAPAIYRALLRARELWQEGVRDAGRISQAARQILESEPLIERIDYVSVADANTLEELYTVQGRAMVSVAVKLGVPRLIDNIILE